MAPIELLLARDGGGCVWCGRELWRSDLTVEHLCPRSRRGSSLAENLLVACRLAKVRIESTLPHVGWLLVGFVMATAAVALMPQIALWLPRSLGY